MSEAQPTATGGFRGKAISGAVFTGLGAGSRAILHVIAIIVLARLLTPDDFGVMGMVFPIIAFATIFQEAGLSLAVVQRERISDPELSTIFWINTALGLLLCLLLVGSAPFVADFYNEPRVAALTAASGLLIFAGALASQHFALLTRNMRFGQLATIDAVSLGVGTALAIGVAYFTRSYWAIFLLSFGTIAVASVMAWLLSGWRPGKRSPVRDVTDVLRFGTHYTIGSIANYFGRNLDKVLIGRFWGTTSLGYYERAYKVVLMPILFVHNPLLRVALPMLSQTRSDPERHRRIFRLSFQLALLLTVPGVVVLAAAAEPLVVLVMGAQWIEGAPVFAWLAVACLGQLVTGPLNMIFLSQDRAREAMVSSVATSIYSSIAFVIGLPWGAVGVAAAYAISEILRTPVMLWYATRKGPVGFAETARALLPFLLATPLCFLVVLVLSEYLGKALGALPFSLLATLAAYAVALPCLFVNRAGRECLAEILSAAGSFRRKLMARAVARPT
jgi:PST family polysaccharide transporter